MQNETLQNDGENKKKNELQNYQLHLDSKKNMVVVSISTISRIIALLERHAAVIN